MGLVIPGEVPLPTVEQRAVAVARALAQNHEILGLVEGILSPAETIRGAADVVARLLPDLGPRTAEALWAIAVDAGGRPLGQRLLTEHCRDAVICEPLAVVSVATAFPGTAGLWLAHNHPSGDPEPSEEDIAATAEIRRVLRSLHLRLEGHVVVVRDGRWRLVP